MSRTTLVLMLSVATLVTVGLANTSSVTGGSGSGSVSRWTPLPSPLPAAQSPAAVGSRSTTIRWDKFYDRSGNLLPDYPQDAVGADSLYWKDFASTTYLKSSAKVQNPSPANRTAMSFHAGQSTPCMDPVGGYVYEVDGTNLYRFSTVDGSMTTCTLAYTGGLGCATDGQHIYVPGSGLSKAIFRYTMTGAFMDSTILDTVADAFSISCVNDTVWVSPDRYNHVYYGYAASKFTGGPITHDATWDVGTGTNGVGNIAWDGTYYYVTWIGGINMTFKRFYAGRTLYSSGILTIDPRSVMCCVQGTRQVTQDTLYWKSYYNTSTLYSSPKTQNPGPAQASALAWQYDQTVPCMTPDGRYVFEAYVTNLRRTDLTTGEVKNYALADAGSWSCGTDGQFVYVPNGTTTRKYTLDGTLVSTTTTDYAPIGDGYYGFGVANDTVWLTPASAGTTWYGYACSGFTGGSLTHDATWTTGGGSTTAMNVAFDGQYYYIPYGGNNTNQFYRFYRDRTLCSSGTVSLDSRGVMCKKGDYAVAICYAASYADHAASLAQMLTDSSGGKFAAADTYYVGSSGHATFPATDWYNHGYRAILAFTDGPPADAAALGDSLARFIQLGGGVVEAPFSDYSGVDIQGNWRSAYAPFTLKTYTGTPGTMGTVHQPSHPIMSDVSALYVSDWRTGNTHSSLRSANCACLSEYTDANLCLAACFDSAGQRAASLGFYPLSYWIATATGQWCRLMVNALNWTAVGPSVGVTVPNGGESWYAGTVHNITWTQTSNCVHDSVYYSTDGGSTWTGVTYFAIPPAPLEYAWAVPPTATTQARVKVVTWDADGGRVEDGSDADFTIVVVHDAGVLSIIQPVDTVDSGAVVVPTAVVRNYGNTQETIPVRFYIGGFYTHDTSATLAPGVTDTVSFLQWMAGPVGTHIVRCSTQLALDTNYTNDRAMDTVVVVSPPPGIAQSENNVLPLVFALSQSYPNPLASGAAIRYALPRPAQVELNIYDVSGTLVRRLTDGPQPAGYLSAYWNGLDDRGGAVASGVYYCRFKADDFLAAQKLVVRR